MALWFSADLHLGHRNVLEYSARPFQSMEEMAAELVGRWNVKVADTDEVWLLGDVGLGSVARLTPILEQLHGVIHLVAGNHDENAVRKHPRFSSSQDYKELRVRRLGREDVHLVMSHYPFMSWNRMHYGALHLHGHSHGNGRAGAGDTRRQDVGVDCWAYAPVGLDEIQKRMAKAALWEPADHHRRD